MQYKVRAHIYVEGLKLPEGLKLGRVSIESNPDGISPLHATAIYQDGDWSLQANRDPFAASAAIGIQWTITAPFRIFHAEQVFPDGQTAPLVFFSEPFGGRVVDSIVDESRRGHALATLIAQIDDETRQLVDWFLWGLQTEQRSRDTRLAVIPYAMVLDGLTAGRGDMKSRWSRLIDDIAASGYPSGPSAGALVRARNSWVKQQNFGSDPGDVTIGDFRELARHGIEIRLGVHDRDLHDQ